MGRVDAQPSAGLEAERAVLGAMLIDRGTPRALAWLIPPHFPAASALAPSAPLAATAALAASLAARSVSSS